MFEVVPTAGKKKLKNKFISGIIYCGVDKAVVGFYLL